MALITPNDGVNDPDSAAVLDVAIYFCRPNDSSLSPKRLVAQMTVDPASVMRFTEGQLVFCM